MQLKRIATLLYLPNNAGGFDVAGCPDALHLAETIERSVNMHEDLVEALHTCLPFLEDMRDDPGYKNGRVDTVLRGVRKLLERLPK